ncbi:hypothetical protein KLP40_00835 [Hymenobacter sp. NST-14]|uniref:hypothetical protein n=1 Tax=Hymenobacter piscis TaxID=2839984 RepID=UPI001C031848|nr:hypothetical protein [Hymenobacter piscis]MBT9391691.1 hypothetical protein [Hymenobacter piscis]
MKTLCLLAGCNGASKTMTAYALLQNLLGCREFVNADEITWGTFAVSAGNGERAER